MEWGRESNWSKRQDFCHIACGSQHTLVVDADNFVFGCGANKYVFCLVTQIRLWGSQCSTPLKHNFIVREMHMLAHSNRTCGFELNLHAIIWYYSNRFGQVGTGSSAEQVLSLTKIETHFKPIQIACGDFHSAAVTVSQLPKREYTWYAVACVQSTGIIIQISSSFVVYLLELNTSARKHVWHCGHSAFQEDGQLFTWGSNNKHQLGNTGHVHVWTSVCGSFFR